MKGKPWKEARLLSLKMVAEKEKTGPIKKATGAAGTGWVGIHFVETKQSAMQKKFRTASFGKTGCI